MTPAQVKEARELIGWSRERLGAFSETTVSWLTIYEETGVVTLRRHWPTDFDPLFAIQAVLEAAGVVFTFGRTPGVRLRQQMTKSLAG